MTDEGTPLPSTPPGPSALHQQRLDHIAEFVRTSKQLQAAWDIYSDQHTDPDGCPYDDWAYELRAARRDADTWQAALHIRVFTRELISTARVQLQNLPSQAVQAPWPWQLACAEAALDQLDAVEADYRTGLDSLPLSAGPIAQSRDYSIAARNAEAWQALNELVLHTPAILAIHAAVQNTPPRPNPLAPRSAPAASDTPRSPGAQR
jgi:hypothetical protein